MPANGRGRLAARQALRRVPQKIYRLPVYWRVRVKWCGKSAPRFEQSDWQGKPHAEQDQIGEEERPAPLHFRVGCWSLSAMASLDEWLPPAARQVQKPAYRSRRYC